MGNRAFEILEDVTYEYMSKIRVVEAMKQYAKECVKASLERASEDADIVCGNSRKTKQGYQPTCGKWCGGCDNQVIDKQSILNEDNIVLV